MHSEEPGGARRRGTDGVDLISSDKVQLVVNSPRGRGPRADGAHLRRAAAEAKVPLLTTAAAALAAANGIGEWTSRDFSVTSLQEHHAGAAAARAREAVPLPRRIRWIPPTTVGSVTLACAVMTASGTAGHGAELAAYLDLSRLGAVVVKSLAAEPWAGNPPPGAATAAGMLNSVGLQGPGVAAWRRGRAAGSRRHGGPGGGEHLGPPASRTTRRQPRRWPAVGPEVVAVEVNLSCPNLDGGAHLFAHDPAAAAEAVRASAGAGLPRWAKLRANTDRVVEVAAAVAGAGADAVTLINTLLGMVIDPASRWPALGGGEVASGTRDPPRRGPHRLRRACRPARAAHRRGRGAWPRERTPWR